MLVPDFPYKDNQIILSSNRVLLNSKSDGIFLFGKRMVALSSTETINLDAKEKILIDCDKIELGHQAEILGEPVILGNKMTDQLKLLVKELKFLGNMLQTVSSTGDAKSWINIQSGGLRLYNACNVLSNILKDMNHPQNPLSKNTYTR